MEILTLFRAMQHTHNKYARLGVVNNKAHSYLISISEFLISKVTFHTPSPLLCHQGCHPTPPLSQSMCGSHDDQKSTKSQIAFLRSGFFYALWSADKNLIPTSITTSKVAQLLANPKVSKIAIANPKLAPYGLAYKQTLNSVGAKAI